MSRDPRVLDLIRRCNPRGIPCDVVCKGTQCLFRYKDLCVFLELTIVHLASQAHTLKHSRKCIVLSSLLVLAFSSLFVQYLSHVSGKDHT